MVVQLVVAAGNRTGHIIPVSGEKFIIGRADDCHLKSRSDLISRYHCAILVGNAVVVRDLGSRNGVQINGEKISAEHTIKNGDKLVVGPLEFYVHIDTNSVDTGSGASADLQTGSYASATTTWLDHPNEGTRTTDSSATVLLNRLKSLNQDIKTEPEQPVLDFLKKFM